MLLGHPLLEGSTRGVHSLQILEHVLRDTDMTIATIYPQVMLSWAKKTFTTIKENVLGDHTTNHK